MPNIAKMLKEEITRLAKKQAKTATAKLRRDTIGLKRLVREHQRRIADLERKNAGLLAEAAERRKASLKTDETEVSKARITAKLIRRTRKKLGLTQAEFAKLVGVSPMSVYQWEQKKGRLTFRGQSKAAVVAARKLRPEEARERLAAMKPAARAKGRRRARRPRR